MLVKDVIVVGAGVMGSATARALARSGKSVTLLERFAAGHRRGSSHGDSRIYRLSYPDPMYVRMAQLAMPLWRDLEDESGQELFVRTGGLDGGPHIRVNAAALARCGVRSEVMTGADAMNRYPMVSLEPSSEYLAQDDAGIVRADEAVTAFGAGARAAGCEVLEETTAQALREESTGVTIETTGGTLRAKTVVVTAGAWAQDLLATTDIDLPVRPTRESVAYFKIEGVPPPALVEWGQPTIYALQSPVRGVKAAEHIAGPVTDPGEQGALNESSLERVETWVGERFALLAPERVDAETCLYTNTEDESFVLERRGRVVIGSPCSGHGFKFAPWIGKRLAELAVEG